MFSFENSSGRLLCESSKLDRSKKLAASYGIFVFERIGVYPLIVCLLSGCVSIIECFLLFPEKVSIFLIFDK